MNIQWIVRCALSVVVLVFFVMPPSLSRASAGPKAAAPSVPASEAKAALEVKAITEVKAVPEDKDAAEVTKAKPLQVMRKCVNREAGVAFACQPSWAMEQRGKVLKVFVSRSPLVEMDIQEIDQKIRLMSDLSRTALASIGRYEDGFHVERFRYCNRETVKVNGYLKGDPVKRVSDFYLIDHQKIHSVKFTAASAQVWEEYKFLIKQIVESVTFIYHDPQAKFLAEDGEGTCEDIISSNGTIKH